MLGDLVSILSLVSNSAVLKPLNNCPAVLLTPPAPSRTVTKNRVSGSKQNCVSNGAGHKTGAVKVMVLAPTRAGVPSTGSPGGVIGIPSGPDPTVIRVLSTVAGSISLLKNMRMMVLRGAPGGLNKPSGGEKPVIRNCVPPPPPQSAG